MSVWNPLLPAQATALRLARLDTHFASQVVSALATTHGEKRPDASHSNLGWSPQLSGLVGRPVQGLVAGLVLADLTWVLLKQGEEVARLGGQGKSVAEGLTWLAEQVARHGLPKWALAPDGYELPDDPRGQGAALGGSQRAGREALAAWFHNADLVLGEVAAAHSGASEVRCWPHHFDIATLISLDEGGDPETARSVGVGMSPGDGGIDEPYFYVNPWPVPSARQGPVLPLGRWHSEGWFGAELRGSELPTADQAQAVRSFLAAAVPAATNLAGA